MSTCDIRIITQYRENYGTEESPYWKAKGSVEFMLKGVDDSVMYLPKDEMDMAIARMLRKRDNPMCTYELIDWEFIFGDPYILDTEDFMKGFVNTQTV